MNIEIAHEAPLRRWQQRLADELSARGHGVALVARGRRKFGLGLAVALALEQRVFGPRSSLFDKVRAQTVDGAAFEGLTDLTIALDGASTEAAIVLEPIFDGGRGDTALLAMLTSDQAPMVQIWARQDRSQFDIVTACPAVEDREILSRGLDQVLARIVTLVLQAVRRLEAGAPSDPSQMESARPVRPSGGALAHVSRAFVRKIAARVTGAGRGPDHWRVGYRRSDAGTQRHGGWRAPSFVVLPDDGSRFYADPMPFEHDGRSYLFLEDFAYATRKAVIAALEIDAAGTASAPRTVLEQTCHLSYPFIIRHRGEIYMLPEMSGARRVQLFRADPFPDRWAPDRILLDNVVAADATPVEHDGRWWMFATLSDDGGSSWDQLCLFHAPDLLGPWTPHADNPVLVDAGAARPAGAIWHEDGVLMRVAQDCRGGYGVGLAICRVDRLDARGYAQTVVARLGPPNGYGADGIHTLNRAGDLEVIDLRISSPCSSSFSPSARMTS